MGKGYHLLLMGKRNLLRSEKQKAGESKFENRHCLVSVCLQEQLEVVGLGKEMENFKKDRES